MTKFEKASSFSRRSLLQSAGALVVSVGTPIGLDTVLGITTAAAQDATVKPPLSPDQLSSFIAVNADGTRLFVTDQADQALRVVSVVAANNPPTLTAGPTAGNPSGPNATVSGSFTVAVPPVVSVTSSWTAPVRVPPIVAGSLLP